MSFSEASYENAVIELFRDQLGYTHRYGPDVDRDYADPLYEPDLLPALRRINPRLPETTLAEALFKLRNFEGGDFIQKNAVFMDYLQHGVQVNFFDQGSQQSSLNP
jgi:type I restriction enzyme R subunit